MMKNILKRPTALLLILAMLVICGCSVENASGSSNDGSDATMEIPETADSEVTVPPEETRTVTPDEELDIIFAKYVYSVPPGDPLDAAEISDRASRNITNTAEHTDPLAGYIVIEDMEILNAYFDLIDRKMEAAEHWQINKSFQTAGLELNDAFFVQNDLLMIDLCIPLAVNDMKTEPVIIESTDQNIVLDFYYGVKTGSTTDNLGTLYLIAIPKGCNAEVNWIPVVEWFSCGYENMPE